jgi:glycerophosphoryl diester phosphodiesterase
VIFETKPTVIGHRGFGAGTHDGYHENTLESYLAAVEHGLSWIELDVQRSLDDQLVIRHDPVTADGDFLVSRDADELVAAGIPRFEDVMAALPPDVAVNIDAKTIIEDAIDQPHHSTAALVAAALRSFAGQRPLFVSSFDPSLLMYLKERKDTLPDIPLGLITWLKFPVWHAIPAAVNLGLDAVCLHTGTLGLNLERPPPVDYALDRVIDVAHRAGLEVLAWSPNPQTAVRLANAGVDALSVNDVPGVLAALAGAASGSSPSEDTGDVDHGPEPQQGNQERSRDGAGTVP